MTNKISSLHKDIKKIIVLAGGSDQIALIRELRIQCPYAEIILVDYNESPLAKPYANRHLQISTLDLKLVLSIAKKESIDLIITSCTDQALLTMAYVSEVMGLRCYLSYEQALHLTNKSYMKKMMISGGIPTTKFRIIGSNENVDTTGLKFPLVIKPVDNNSSKGIGKVSEMAQLSKAVIFAKENSRSKQIIIEEFKQGMELSIDAYIINGEAKLILITNTIKIQEKIDKFTIIQSHYPVILPNNVIDKILEIIKRISLTFKLDNCPLLIQLIYDGNDVNVIEFSARTGGGSKYYLIKELTGENVLKHLIDLTLNNRVEIICSQVDVVAAMTYVYCKPGKILRFDNILELKKTGVIVDYFVYKPLGTYISSAESSSDRPLAFFVTANSDEELFEKISIVNRNLKVMNEKNEDIMLHSLYE